MISQQTREIGTPTKERKNTWNERKYLNCTKDHKDYTSHTVNNVKLNKRKVLVMSFRVQSTKVMSWSLTILFCVLKLWKFSAASFWLMQFWQVLQFQWLILPSVKVSPFVMAGSSFMDHQLFFQTHLFLFV